MALVSPVDEGQPNFTSMTLGASWKNFNGSNFSTAGRFYLIYDITGTRVLLAECFPNSSAIHDQTLIRIYDSAWDSTTGSIKIVNPIGYKEIEPSKVLQDILVHQAQVARGRVRVFPTGDKGTNQWTRSIGSAAHYTYVDEGTDTPDTTGFYLYTATVGLSEIFTCYNQTPTNFGTLKEVVIKMWIKAFVGTDRGMTFVTTLYSNGTPMSGRSEIIPSDNQYHYHESRHQAQGWTKAQTDLLEIGVQSGRNYVGGSPNPAWFLATIDIELVYDPSNYFLIDEVTFDNQHTYYSTNNCYLSGDLYGEEYSFREACMDTLKHAPDLFLFVNYLGQLSCGRVTAFADETSPYEISYTAGNLKSIDRVYTHDARLATDLYAKYMSRCKHRTEATALVDPDNEINYLQWNKLTHKYNILKRHLNIERPLFRDNTSVVFATDTFDNMYNEPIDAVDITMNHHAFRIEQGDVVNLNEPLLGFDNEKLLVVEKSPNFDTLDFKMKLYKLEVTLS